MATWQPLLTAFFTLGSHFKLHSLYLAATLYSATCNFIGLSLGSHVILHSSLIMDAGSQTSLQKNPYG